MSYPKFSKHLARKIAAGSVARTNRGGRTSTAPARSAAFAVVFAAIGSILLFGAHAATGNQALTLSPQSGQIAGNASVVTDNTAVGNRAARFGTGSTGGTTPPTSCGTSTSGAAQPSGSSYGNDALHQWNCALANRASTPATWVTWGDSIDEGEGSTTVTGRWINQVLANLRTVYPTSGVAGGFGYLPSFYGTYGVSDPSSAWKIQPQTGGGTSWNLDGNQLGNGPGLGLRTVTIPSGGTIKFSVSGTSADIMYNYGSGSFKYQIDSGSATTISTSGGSGAAGVTHVAYSSAGSHTITVTGVSGSVILEGVMEYNGDESKGIRVYEGGQCSLTTANFMNQLTAVAAITAKTNPDLVTINLGGNDYNNGSPSASQVTTNLKSMVSAIRSASTGHEPSIVLVIPYENTSSQWKQYTSAIRAVTTADPTVGLLDMSTFANNGSDSSLLTSDGHPNNAGQTKYATWVESYLEDK